MQDKPKEIPNIYNHNDILMLFIGLVAKFAKSPKKDLRKYFVLLKHKKIEQVDDNNGQQPINKEGYYLAMDLDIQETIWQYFYGNKYDSGQLESWLRMLRDRQCMVIDYHPFIRVLVELSKFSFGQEDTKTVGRYSMRMASFYHLNTDEPRPLDYDVVKKVTREIAHINGLISVLFEYASSTVIAQEVRKLDRRFNNREESLKKQLAGLKKGSTVEVVHFGFDCGRCFNNEQNMKNHLDKIKLGITKIISDFKNTYASKSNGRPLNLLYAWNISFYPDEADNEKQIGMRFHFFLLDVRTNSDGEDTVHEKEQGIEVDPFITIFSDEMKHKLKDSLGILDDRLKLGFELETHNMGTWPLKNELIALIVGDKTRVINWTGDKKLVTKFFDSGHL